MPKPIQSTTPHFSIDDALLIFKITAHPIFQQSEQEAIAKIYNKAYIQGFADMGKHALDTFAKEIKGK